MTNRTAATRYARALLDVAVQETTRSLAGKATISLHDPAKLYAPIGEAERRYAGAVERGAALPDPQVLAALQETEQQLGAFVDLLKQHPTLETVLLNPAVPVPRKRAVIAELTERLGLSGVLSKLLALLADRDRLGLLPELLSAFGERVLDYRQVVRAEVTTAEPLEADGAQAIERRLALVTGRQVTVTTAVDPSLIGGLVARIGSTVYDGSITTQLRKMKVKLAESV